MIIEKDMPIGSVGDLTRVECAILEYGQNLDAAFGDAVIYDSTKGGFKKVSAVGDGAKVYGILARVAPETPDSKSAGVMVRGYVKVKVNGQPKRGDAVNIYVTDGGDGKAVGTFAAAAESSKTEAVANATFAIDGADAYGVTVIRIL